MAEKKDQFIVAYIADYEEVSTVISYSVFLSLMLKKGIILLRICDPQYTNETTAEAETKLKEIKTQIPSKILSTYCVLKGTTKNIISLLPKALGAVAIASAISKNKSSKSPISPKRIFKDFSQCRVAFLLAQEPLKDFKNLQKVAFTLDFKRESKEKLIWASYFCRFAGSTLYSLSYDYTDEFLRNKWYSNVKFMDKMFGNLGVTYQKQSIGSRQKLYMDVLALDIASQLDIGLMIATTTNERDAIEVFIGVQETRTAVNKYKIPMLFLNPREDLYVLCD